MKLTIVPPDGDGPAAAASYGVYLDDTQIYPAGLKLDMDPRNLPVVTLDVDLFRLDRTELHDPQILISPPSRDLLVKLGWTPPAAPSPVEADALRIRIADALMAEHAKTAIICEHTQMISFGALAARVLTIRDEEMERLRGELTEWQNAHTQALQWGSAMEQRATLARTRLDQLRAYARWCTDRSVEPDESDILALANGTCRADYIALMDGADETPERDQ